MDDNKKEKIKVDKEFFEMMVKKITDLENKFNEKSEKPIEISFQQPKVGEDYIFECMASVPGQVLPENQLEFNMKINEFSGELKILMKKYNFVKSSGIFIAKNIN